MRKLYQLQAMLVLVMSAVTAFGQISNTSTTITLQNNPSSVQQKICSWNQTIPTGIYSIEVKFISEDYANYGNWVTLQATGTVVNNISSTGQLIIDVPSLTFPTEAVDGYSLMFTQGIITINGAALPGPWRQLWDFDQYTCEALPLFITDFYVDKTYSSSNYFKINWQTMAEHNTSHFVIQRSGDGRHFTDVLMEPAAGESDSTINYTGYINGTGYNWFRLKAIDLDGSYQYSDIRWWEVVRSGASNFCSFMYLEGADKICGTSGVYKLHNVPVGSVNWSLNAYGNLAVSNAGLIATVNRTGVGNAVLTATAPGGCTRTKNLLLGSPYISGTYISNGQEYPLAISGDDVIYFNDVCKLQNVNTNMQTPGASTVTWSKVSSYPSTLNWSQTGNNISFYFYNLNQNATFRIQAANACGSASYDFAFRSIDCSGGGGCTTYQIASNPARGSVRVAVAQIIPPCYQALAQSQSKLAPSPTISEIRIYDQQGNMRSRQTFAKTSNAQVNVSNLKSGVYFIEISDGLYTEKQQLIIQN